MLIFTPSKALYDNQLKKNWKFRTRIDAILSENVKLLIKSLLEPDIQKRFIITQVINSEWISMDSRLKGVCNVFSLEIFTP